jgi:hypothetical protein
MDPLSVTASIVGILAAAAKIAESLQGMVSTAKNAPRVLVALDCEIREFQTALSSLQTLLADLSSIPTHRAALIQVEQLVVTLTEAVLTFSELDALRGSKVPVAKRLRWTQAEGNCLKLVERIQRHKASISLMLHIFQWYDYHYSQLILRVAYK